MFFFDSISFKDERSEVEEFREVKSVALDSSLMLRMTGVIWRNPQSLRDSPFKKGRRKYKTNKKSSQTKKAENIIQNEKNS